MAGAAWCCATAKADEYSSPAGSAAIGSTCSPSCARGGLSAGTPCRIAPAPDRPPTTHPDADARRIARATYIWTVAENGSGSPAAYYLASRGIVLNPWPAVLRYHRRCRHPSGETMPAIVALVEHVSRGIV